MQQVQKILQDTNTYNKTLKKRMRKLKRKIHIYEPKIENLLTTAQQLTQLTQKLTHEIQLLKRQRTHSHN
jgi:uncharacterized protein involved in exopolysaccharide biosynthesis